MSARKYAEHRKALGLSGGTHTAVNKALREGRIAALPDGTLDPEACDKAWAENSKRSAGKGDETPPIEKPSASPKPPVQPPPRPLDSLLEEPEDPEEGGDSESSLFAGLESLEAIIRQLRSVLDRSDQFSKTEAEKVKEIFLVLQRKLDYEKKAGNLVEVEPIKKRLYEIWRAERDAWQNWPARVGAIIAARLGVDQNQFTILLEEHVVQHLSERSEQPRLRVA